MGPARLRGFAVLAQKYEGSAWILSQLFDRVALTVGAGLEHTRGRERIGQLATVVPPNSVIWDGNGFAVLSIRAATWLDFGVAGGAGAVRNSLDGRYGRLTGEASWPSVVNSQWLAAQAFITWRLGAGKPEPMPVLPAFPVGPDSEAAGEAISARPSPSAEPAAPPSAN